MLLSLLLAGLPVSTPAALDAPSSPQAPATALATATAPTGADETPDATSLGARALAVSVLKSDGLESRLDAVLARPGSDAPFVLAYTGVGCPISGKYAPRLQSLAERYAAEGVRFLAVNANPQDSIQAVAEEARELGLRLPVVKDVRQELTRLLGARTTTEAFVFDGAGALVYRGAVDDQYALGAAKPAPTAHLLTDALDAAMAGAVAPVAEANAPGCKLTLLDEDELPGAITWSKDIAKIVQNNCESCHRTGQVGPFTLQSYEKVKGWSAMISDVVSEGRMPPWNASPDYRGHFANERRLRDADKAKLLRWIEDGMPRGNPAEDPEPAVWPEGWSIGTPEVVFEMERWFEGLDVEGTPLPEEGYEVPREGTVEYKHFAVQTNFDEDRWIRALEIQPGAADVVHHVLVLCDDPAAPRAERREALEFRSFLAGYAPGDMPSVYPEGYAKKLPAGATLIFQLHYTPNGKQRFDRSRIGLSFWDEPPFFEVVTDSVMNEDFRIPPGAENFRVEAELEIEEDTGVLVLLPHMHTRGRDFRFIAHYPDGSSEDLLEVTYDFNWQESYLLRDPLFLPGGTRLQCIGHFDNSASNPNNPDPEAWVEFGEQTWDEMFIGFFDKVVELD